MDADWSFRCGSVSSYIVICKEKSLHFVNVHQVVNMSKETLYHGRHDDVQSVQSLYEVTERDRKLKPEWKVLVGGLCTLAMLLECSNVVLSSQRGTKDQPIEYSSETTLCVSMEVINSRLAKATGDPRCAPVRDEIDQPSKRFASRSENTLL